MAYSYLGILGIVSSKEAGFEAKKHAEKSLYLDDSLAEAHVAMAWVLTFNDWDFPAAEKECKLALELNPNLALAHVEMAFLALFDRRLDEAISEVDRALALDPMSAEVNQRAGVVFLYSRKYDDAIQQFNRALAIDPDNEFARFNLGLAHVQKGMFEVGLQEMQKKVSKSDLAYAYSKAGRLDDVKKLLNELLGEVDKNSELAIGVAAAYANLGDHERAIDWLERAFTDRASYLAAANVDFVFDTIRKDLRFQALMKRLGYTNYE